MMSVEGPFLTSLIARLAEPKFNLAAHGISFALAMIIESPIIMMMSASTAIVEGKNSLHTLRRFAYSLSIGITFFMFILLIPQVFNFFTYKILDLPENVAKLTYYGTIALLPWPAAIGFRRFYQGLLIKNGLTKLVAFGTIIRLASMSGTALFIYFFTDIPGVLLGSIALSSGVVLEAITSRFMVQKTIVKLNKISNDKTRTYFEIAHFYYPLALTAVLAMGIQPVITFFVGHSKMAIESLAVLPVLNGFVFIFRSVGLSFQEVGIALVDKNGENFRKVRNFALILSLFASGIFALFAFTDLSILWFGVISGLTTELIQLTKIPLLVFLLMPFLSVTLNIERAMIVKSEKTKLITYSTLIEITATAILLYFTIYVFDFIGVLGASIAVMLGRFFSVSFLTYFYLKTTKKWSVI